MAATSRDSGFHDIKRVHLIAAGRYHDMDFARIELLKLIGEIAGSRTTVASGWGDLESLAAADLLVTYTCDIAPTPAEIAALRAFIEAGGRWIALHGTNALLRFLDDGRIGVADDASDFVDLIGTRFLAHPPIGPFRVEVEAPEHPLVQGIEAFDVVDELYLFERRAEILPLLVAPFTGSTVPFAADRWENERSPVLYLRHHGEGTVLYCSLGHCRSHYDPSPNGAFVTHPLRCAWDYPVYYELLRRSLRWGIHRN